MGDLGKSGQGHQKGGQQAEAGVKLGVHVQVSIGFSQAETHAFRQVAIWGKKTEIKRSSPRLHVEGQRVRLATGRHP